MRNSDELLRRHKEIQENPHLLDEIINDQIDENLDDKFKEKLHEENAIVQKLFSDENFKKDISSDQDLTIALMNLIGIEEHLFFTGAKTEKTEYYDLITEIRTIRKKLLGKIIKEYEGEVWCISKHLLAASYRLMEVGTKQLDRGRNKEAYELFDEAYSLYCLFWGINKKIFVPSTDNKSSDSTKDQNKKSSGILDKIKNITALKVTNDSANVSPQTTMSKLKSLVKKVVDCCIE